MEQPTLTSEQSRWAAAIAKLTTFTHTGKLHWVRVDTDSENSLSSIGLSFTSSKYEAELSGQTLRLIVSKPVLNANNSWSELLGLTAPPLSSTKVNFRAYDQYGRKEADLTGLSILNTLASAVEAESSSREAAVLTAIENA